MLAGMRWTYPLPPVETTPLPLTDEWRRVIADAIVELRELLPLPQGSAPPEILVTDMTTLPSDLLPPGYIPFGAYCNNPTPVVLVDEVLPPFLLRSLIRHELAHWAHDMAGVPDSEEFAAAFGRDPQLIAEMRADREALGLPKAAPGFVYRPERDGLGGIVWRLRLQQAKDLPRRTPRDLPTAASGVFDSDEAYEHFFIMSDRVFLFTEALLWLRFREFFASAKSAASSGSLTSDSGGGSTTVSGGGSTSGNPGGLPTDGGSAHIHQVAAWVSDTPGVYTKRKYTASGPTNMNIEAANANTIFVESEATHYHTLPGHTHSTPNHQHATPDHQHTVPGHTHGLVYGIFKETMPGSISVILGIYQKESPGEAWNLQVTVSGITDAEVLLDLTELGVTFGAGLWRLTLQSAAGQPNNGRLAVDVVGQAMGAVQAE
jgi:hypothetical protein